MFNVKTQSRDSDSVCEVRFMNFLAMNFYTTVKLLSGLYNLSVVELT